VRKPEGWHHPTVGLSAINKFKVRAPALYMYRGCMDETETILKPETKTERRLITMLSIHFFPSPDWTVEAGPLYYPPRGRLHRPPLKRARRQMLAVGAGHLLPFAGAKDPPPVGASRRGAVLSFLSVSHARPHPRVYTEHPYAPQVRRHDDG
jgi:hypothetical protein